MDCVVNATVGLLTDTLLALFIESSELLPDTVYAVREDKSPPQKGREAFQLLCYTLSLSTEDPMALNHQ